MIDMHMHTDYCPHASRDKAEDYILKSIEKNIVEIAFTEHAPLPMDDTVPAKDSAMISSDVNAYLKEISMLKEKYTDRIIVNAGFEIDYIEGKENETIEFLKHNPETIPYSILSVHFVLIDGKYFCIDYSPESFMEKADKVGYEALVKAYEDTLMKALSKPYGSLTPKRIGHIDLIKKFKRFHGRSHDMDLGRILEAVKKNGYSLDINTSGYDKEYCREPYPSIDIIRKAVSMGIPVVTGSDAHSAKEVGRHFDKVSEFTL
ncbi:histidinol-phosphatase (PHP family) [Youngiibacter multivorans]|uniref:Histidinol-phosphatase n=2 Tax=Youngiibacter multivorans TaxID=937251 RepID=A0ABS4G6U9_9CLOT|nr:histidinol-phosphatase (PHP family) [Youngiibacter multivorans]